MAQPYKINGSTNGFEKKDIASFNVKFYDCEKKIGLFDSGVEKLAAQNVASQVPVHDCSYVCKRIDLTGDDVPDFVPFDPRLLRGTL